MRSLCDHKQKFGTDGDPEIVIGNIKIHVHGGRDYHLGPECPQHEECPQIPLGYDPRLELSFLFQPCPIWKGIIVPDRSFV